MTAPATYHINTSPRTLADGYANLDRLADLRELGRLTHAEYYPLDAELTGWLDELERAHLIASAHALNPQGAAERMAARHKSKGYWVYQRVLGPVTTPVRVEVA